MYLCERSLIRGAAVSAIDARVARDVSSAKCANGLCVDLRNKRTWISLASRIECLLHLSEHIDAFHRELISRYEYGRPGMQDQPWGWLLFRRARFVNGPPVPAGGTVKDQRMRQLVLDEGHRALACGADEAGVSRWCQWCGRKHTALRGKPDTTTDDARSH